MSSLFAALDVANGITISNYYRRHGHQEFLRFLNDIDASLPRGCEVHLVMDNYGTHKVKKGANVVGSSSPLSRPLHAHEWQLAESGRAIVRRDDGTLRSPWQPYDGSSAGNGIIWTGGTKILNRLCGPRTRI